MPLATSIFAVIIDGEQQSMFFWICGVAVAALIVTFAMSDSSMQLSTGDLFLFLASLSANLSYVVSGKLLHRMPS